ncbi:MAG: ABC transporter substrate-binding protein [Alphaproteobacteria bacterium]|nr:ABC transporter substrate-binding protein [Alphaproteobacteria bacterium]
MNAACASPSRLLRTLAIGCAALGLAIAQAGGAPVPSAAEEPVPEAAAPAPSGPHATIDRLDTGLLAIMREARTLAFEGRRDAIAPILAESFDFATLAAGSVGRAVWADWTAEERARYRDAFVAFTVATYAGRFDGYSGEAFAIVGQEPGPAGTVLVRTRLERPKAEAVAIDYLMRERDGAWRVIDVFLEGTISELARQRSEFGAILLRKGFDGLIAALGEKTDELAAGKGQPSARATSMH